MASTDIVKLFWDRDETAIEEASRCYGHYLYAIAYNVLRNKEDSDESVNDTYLAAWDVIPPQKPSRLDTFLGKITRRIAVSKWRKQHADKRGGGELPMITEELGECLSDHDTPDRQLDRRELSRVLTAFVSSLPLTQRELFLRRYWFSQTIAEIASACHQRESAVKTALHRIRKKLAKRLEEEGFA